jgi:hypothetical protein
MSTEIVTTTDKILETIRYVVVALTGYWMILAIIGL